MNHTALLSPDEIRSRFSALMSEMYRQEVPQYGTLLTLVDEVNEAAVARDGALRAQFEGGPERARLDVERHGAIRLGTAQELHTMRRIFAVMGMEPVGYYDLSVAGVPVHSTAFRPVEPAALARNPFRVFTSLLRLELIADEALRETAAGILRGRHIFTPRALALVGRCEAVGGLTSDEADAFVCEVRETFRWHRQATVSAATYQQLHDAHRLIADVVCFKGPHINHLTPRTLDIDAVQAGMPQHGITPKDVIEGPPPRRVPILLRQTSFKALDEPVLFPEARDGNAGTGGQMGTHTARFGEIEQRGMALTRKGRALYDALLQRVRQADGDGSGGETQGHEQRLAQVFAAFPDDMDDLRRQGLGFFRYRLTPLGEQASGGAGMVSQDIEALIGAGLVQAEPLIYEDFLPVSAAGIFQSNLGGTQRKTCSAQAAQAAFEAALGAPVHDEVALYEAAERASLAVVKAALSDAVVE
ncbi:2-oxoadipate dioxygenase/decarboxylase HglS [Hydrogenophaga sp. A37]|uniref:2-oxoadipate dioxygenase/decarboxylase HglS n=1 Tax=Hydrogenophaga sp. A37 TaxID=1945864 RepID=UPI000987C53E|nr:VOC family protein [Hydrogenophaga sp. A37]OOG79644.1 DUF1338 domain-containing protein [Hydrogenophaga sp. A37]